MSAVEVLDPGRSTLLQDEGRPGWAAVGVGRSGAADRGSYLLGSRLVAHGEGRAALEVLLGGLVVRAHGSLTVALTGAVGPALIGGVPVPHGAPLRLHTGEVLRLGMPSAGLRTYLTVRGGLVVDPVLGSRSTDTLAGLGPPAVRAGDVLPVGAFTGAFPGVDVAPVAPPPTSRVVLDITPGPRHDWFDQPEALAGNRWAVSARSDRAGVRLEGSTLTRHPAYRGRELPSEGMVRGCVQVPPGGQPVLLLNDHPVTGGYPVIGVVTPAGVDRAAQLQPGQEVGFRWLVS